MEAKIATKQGKQIANVKLTDEQRALIERATGVSLKEITVIEQTGDAARALNPSLLKASAVVMGW